MDFAGRKWQSLFFFCIQDTFSQLLAILSKLFCSIQSLLFLFSNNNNHFVSSVIKVFFRSLTCHICFFFDFFVVLYFLFDMFCTVFAFVCAQYISVVFTFQTICRPTKTSLNSRKTVNINFPFLIL